MIQKKRRIRIVSIILLVSMFLVFYGSSAFGLVTWTGNAAGDETNWFNGSNWGSGVAPGPGDTVVIPTGRANYPVIDDLAEMSDLTLMTGSSLTVDNGSLYVTGSCSVNGNAILTFIGSGQFDAASLDIEGSVTIPETVSFNIQQDCTVKATGSLSAGYGDFDSLTVNAGGSVSLETASGTVYAASLDLNGDLTISGGVMFSADAIYIGMFGHLIVRNGQAEFYGNLDNDGSVSIEGGSLSFDQTGEHANNNSLEITGGTFSILDGSFVNYGTMTLDGGNFHFESGYILNNSGTFNWKSGNLGSNQSIPWEMRNNDTMHLTTSGAKTLGVCDFYNYDSYIQTNEVALNVSGNTGQEFKNLGDFSGSGSIRFLAGQNLFTNGGILDPGPLPGGMLQINGDFEQLAAGSLEISVTSNNNYDRVDVQGTAWLDGELVVDTYTPSIVTDGDSYNVLTAATLNDTFATTTLTPPTGFVFGPVTYSGTNVVIPAQNRLNAVFVWTGDEDDDVSNPNNWSTGIVPGETDIIEINENHNFDPYLDVDATIRGLILDNFSFEIPDLISLTVGSGGITIQNNGELVVNGYLSFGIPGISMDTGYLTNHGDIEWNGGNIQMENTSYFGTDGFFLIQSIGDITGDGTSGFESQGDIRKTSAGTNAISNVSIYLTGGVSIESGALDLKNPAGDPEYSADFSISDGAYLHFGSGRHTLGTGFYAYGTGGVVIGDSSGNTAPEIVLDTDVDFDCPVSITGASITGYGDMYMNQGGSFSGSLHLTGPWIHIGGDAAEGVGSVEFYMSNSSGIAIDNGVWFTTGLQTTFHNSDGTASGLVNRGVLSGNGTIDVNNIPFDNDGGYISPGTSPGVIRIIDPDYVHEGILEIEIAGSAESEYDHLIIEGTVTPGGYLEATLASNFIPEPGTHFRVMSFDGAVSGMGGFADYTLPGPDWSIEYGTTQVDLVYGASLPQEHKISVFLQPDDSAGKVTTSDGTIYCPETCEASFPDGETVTLTAEPAPGFMLDHWTVLARNTELLDNAGNTTATDPSTTTPSVEETDPWLDAEIIPAGETDSIDLTLSSDVWVRAVFKEIAEGQHRLVIGIYPEESGTVFLNLPISDTDNTNATPSSFECPDDCEHFLDPDTRVTLKAKPGEGYVFGYWRILDLLENTDTTSAGGVTLTTGEVTSDGTEIFDETGTKMLENPLEILMDGNKRVIAVFLKPDETEKTLSLNITPEGSGSIQVASESTEADSSGNNTGSAPESVTCPETCESVFASGTSLTLTAIPAEGYVFQSWIILDTSIDTGGSTSKGGAISLRQDETSGDPTGVETTSTDVSDDVSILETGNPITIKMDANKRVTAVFRPTTSEERYVLLMNVQPENSGSILWESVSKDSESTASADVHSGTCPDACSDAFEPDAVVRISAVASPGFAFERWLITDRNHSPDETSVSTAETYDVSKTENPATIQMDAGKTVIAVFREIQSDTRIHLSLSTSPEGVGTLKAYTLETGTGDDAHVIDRITCPEECEGDFPLGTRIAFSAESTESAWKFDHYSVNGTETTASGNVILLTEDTTVTAFFTAVSSVNLPPEEPLPWHPEDHAVVEYVGPGTIATLRGGEFIDPDGDPQTESRWKIWRSDRNPGDTTGGFLVDIVLSSETTSDLTTFVVTGLKPGLKYTWTVAYKDAGSGIFTTSKEFHFTVGSYDPALFRPNSPFTVTVPPGETVLEYRIISFYQWPDRPFCPDAFFQDELPDWIDSPNMIRIGSYDPAIGGYSQCGEMEIRPGRAFWCLAREGIDLKVSGVSVNMDEDIDVELSFSSGDGWNMISTPAEADFDWNQVLVIVFDSQNNIVFGPTAIGDLPDDPDNPGGGSPYIDKRLWHWTNSETYPFYYPTGAGGNDPAAYLVRHKGYWVKARTEGVRLRFPASAQVTAPEGELFSAGQGKSRGLKTADESPPLPMAGLNQSETDNGGGCFINSTSRWK